MEKLIAVAGVVFVAAITPGPNNLIVLQAAARSGVTGALPAIVAIVLGSLTLLAIVTLGAGAMLQAHPSVGVTVTICGCVYLCWLGISLIRAGERTEIQNDGAPGGLPARPLGVFAFQFMNPKGWVMMLTATATGLTFAHLAPLVTAIPLGCLLAWSMLGSTLRQQLERGAFRKAFERAMGALLIGSALFLLL